MQPEYFVNIKSGSTVQGSGPITSISDWTVTRRMDAAGSWSFRMSAADALAGQVVLKRTAEIYAFVNTAYALVGSGVIDSIERQISAEGVESLLVQGNDLLRELTYRTVKDLTIVDIVPGGQWTAQGALGSATAVRGLATAQVSAISLRFVAAGNDGHIYRTADGGATWTDQGQLGSETDISHLWRDDYSSAYFYASTPTSSKIYRSTDYGATWAQKSTWVPDCPIVRTNSYFVVANAATMYRYTGPEWAFELTSWSNEGALGSQTAVNALYVVSSGVLVAGTAAGGRIYRSTNTGDTWSDIGRLGSATAVPAIAGNGAVVVAGTNEGKIYRSADSGATWGAGVALASATNVASIIYVGNSTFLAGTGANGKIYRSTDDGVSWSEAADLTEASVDELHYYAATTYFAERLLGGGGTTALVYLGEDGDTPATHSDAVDMLEALAPAGWTFVADGTPGNDDIYIEFAGETLLAAALLLAERSETHCYLSAARTLTYTDTWTASNVHAIGPVNTGALDAATAGIVDLAVQADGYEIVTRVYPYGKDVDGNRLGIGATTVTSLSGYTIDAANNYVQITGSASPPAGYDGYGLIERWINFDDVKAQTSNAAEAADALVKAAVIYLNRMSQAITNYRVRLVGCATLLTPMQTVRVSYVGDAIVDDTLYIVEATWSGDGVGIMTTGLVVSDAPMRLDTGAEATAKSMQRVQSLAAR